MKIIYTDLDGTLLDHQTYSAEAALPALKRCANANIPVIINTSKTYQEVVAIQKSLNLCSPFIIENGAAVCLPKDFLQTLNIDINSFMHTNECADETDFIVKVFAKPNTYWQQIISKMTQWHSSFVVLSQITTNELIKLTGLNPDSARHAQQRQYGEPLYWLGSEQEKTAFIKEISTYGAVPIQGGRFLHINGATNKGLAQEWLTHHFKIFVNELIQTIALGDGMNDIPMLDNADIAVLVKSPAYDFPPLSRTQNVIKTTLEGPAGWNSAILELCTK